jgi:hypothetical protein
MRPLGVTSTSLGWSPTGTSNHRGLPVAASSAVKVSASELTAYRVRPPLPPTHTAWVLAVGLAEATSDR